jgi:hypothetical protein
VDGPSFAFGATLSVVLISVLAAEIILTSTWSRRYFTTGLPVLVWRVSAKPRQNAPPDEFELEAHFQSSWVNSLSFKKLDSHTYAFREKLFELRFFPYLPIMRGLIQFDIDNSQVVVTGFAYWYVLVFALFWFGIAFQDTELQPSVMPIACFLSGIAYSYVRHLHRFTEVAEFASRAWSEWSRAGA